MTTRTRILYDGECSLCQQSVQRLLQRDRAGRLEAVDLHRVNLAELHPALNREACLRELHVVTPQHRVLRGFDAFRHIARQWPSARWWSWLLAVPPVPQVGRAVYRWVARHRYQFSSACQRAACQSRLTQ